MRRRDMYAVFTKGKQRRRISTGEKRVLVHVTCMGEEGLPFRHTVDDPEALAEEMAANLIAQGYTRTDI
jgi:hypothetical protein